MRVLHARAMLSNHRPHTRNEVRSAVLKSARRLSLIVLYKAHTQKESNPGNEVPEPSTTLTDFPKGYSIRNHPAGKRLGLFLVSSLAECLVNLTATALFHSEFIRNSSPRAFIQLW
jgi:hypothetical protein